MILKFQNGKESPLFGFSDSYYYPNEEIPLPDKAITKIDFHKGKWLGDYYPEFLGGLTIHFSDGTSQKVGPLTDTNFKSVEFGQGQYWVGLKTLDNYFMHYQVQRLTLKYQ